jgi:hypothetical protein
VSSVEVPVKKLSVRYEALLFRMEAA